MTRPKHKPRYRIKRTDIFSHHKTRGMRAGSYALMDYAMAQNILGIARESPKSLASHFEGMSTHELHLSIKCMVLRNVARWWPEFDILWIVECLDEQSFSEDSDRGALPIMATLPEPVRAAVALRYGSRVEGGGRPSPSPPTVDAPQKSRRAEEQESLRDSPPTPSRGGNKKTARTDSDFALVAQSLTADSPTASPANDLPGEESVGVLRACEPAPSKPRRGKPRVDYPEGLDEHLLAALQAACRSLTPPLRGPRKVTDGMRDLLRKLWAECEPTREDVDHVVAVRAAMTRRGEGYGSLTWDSICVASNFRRWLAERADNRPKPTGRAEVSSHPTQSGVLDLRARIAKETP